MHIVACIKLMHLFRIEFQMCVMNHSFAYIMIRNLEFNFVKIFNQSEHRNRSWKKEKICANMSENEQTLKIKLSRSTMEN